MPQALPIIAAGVSIVNGVRQMRGGNSGPSPQAAQQAADPFAPYRDFFGSQVMSFLPNIMNPNYNRITDDPGYKFLQEQSAAAAQNGTRAMVGSERSGALPQEIMDRSAGIAGTYANQFDNRNLAIMGTLGGFAGAGQNPAAGPSAGMNAAASRSGLVNGGMYQIGAGLNGIGQVNWNDIRMPFMGGGGGGNIELGAPISA